MILDGAVLVLHAGALAAGAAVLVLVAGALAADVAALAVGAGALVPPHLERAWVLAALFFLQPRRRLDFDL